VEGQNLVVERRWIEGREERIPALVAELLGNNVDVLVTTHTGAVRAAKQATSTVPIVMAGVSNPERTGLVKSLARPGGNVTGVSNMFAESSAKIVELFKEACPNRSRLGVLMIGDP
jgi:putative tryptophan/tyrosine transport system substrate-binding protein